MPFNLVTRDQWGAAPPLTEIPALETPILKVIMTKTRTEPCNNDEECMDHMRQLQKFHMDSGMDDIAYNFVVTPDCKVYEGRGWYKVSPTPKERPELKNKSLVIAHIGDFPDHDQRERLMIRAIIDLIDFGITNNKLIDIEHKFMEIYPFINNDNFKLK